ncbi:MAG: RidA family protein [Candidatus Tectomicrobia bacterium]|nr:RidA family protein [Candidatus Tectomicrobia bacterium]
MGEIEAKLERMGLKLPTPMKAAGTYEPAIRVGNLVFVSGVGPRKDGALVYKGKVGRDISMEEGYAAAKLCAVNSLGNIKAIVGDLDQVERIVKVLGFVNAPEGFEKSPLVINGFSDLLVELWSERGRHARSAIGVAALPSNISVEVEMVVQLKS